MAANKTGRKTKLALANLPNVDLLDSLSKENRTKIRLLTQIILDEMQLGDIDTEDGVVKVPFATLNQKDFSEREIILLTNWINKVARKPYIKIINPEIRARLAFNPYQKNQKLGPLPKFSERDISEFLIADLGNQWHQILTAVVNHLESIDQIQTDEFYRFTLTRDAMLCRTISNTTEKYKMEKNRLPHKIIVELRKAKHRISTDELAVLTAAKDQKMVRTTIGHIKRRVRTKFPGIKGNDFIDGVQRSRYKLGSKIHIRLQ